MTDIVISDVPDEVIAALDERAKRLGLSRTAYLRRMLDRERYQPSGPVTVDHLARISLLTDDLDDPSVTFHGWT